MISVMIALNYNRADRCENDTDTRDDRGDDHDIDWLRLGLPWSHRHRSFRWQCDHGDHNRGQSVDSTKIMILILMKTTREG